MSTSKWIAGSEGRDRDERQEGKPKRGVAAGGWICPSCGTVHVRVALAISVGTRPCP